MWYIHIMEFYSALKRVENMTYAIPWIKVDKPMLNIISLSKGTNI